MMKHRGAPNKNRFRASGLRPPKKAKNRQLRKYRMVVGQSYSFVTVGGGGSDSSSSSSIEKAV